MLARPRSRGSAKSHRSGPRAHDRGGSSVRGHRQPDHGRWHHGALRRPLAHEDHAIRACYAALDMQARIRSYTEEVQRTHGCEIQIRVGLHSGRSSYGSHRQRPPYGLFGRGPDHTSCGPDGTAGQPMARVRLTADTLRLLRVRRGPIARTDANQGDGEHRRGLRDWSAQPRPDAPASRRRAWPDAVRRSAARARAARATARSWRRRATARSWPSSARPGLGSRGSSMSSRARIGWEAGWSSRPAPRRTQSRAPIARSYTC